MAFCNSCGATVDSGAKFCPKCGKGLPETSAGMAPPPAPAKSSSGLKIVLIVGGVVVLLFVVGVAISAFVGWRVFHSTRVRQDNGNVKVETPFGTVESNTDSGTAVRDLGVDVYPGATARTSSSAN